MGAPRKIIELIRQQANGKVDWDCLSQEEALALKPFAESRGRVLEIHRTPKRMTDAFYPGLQEIGGNAYCTILHKDGRTKRYFFWRPKSDIYPTGWKAV